ncbi:MAG: tetratricopeptide repeat protein [Planctomycetes bacterium]|nr:tetratricopeptide repeat protein [Planctomycetota bacterium]
MMHSSRNPSVLAGAFLKLAEVAQARGLARILLAVLFFTRAAAAEEVDREKLRQLAKLPRTAVTADLFNLDQVQKDMRTTLEATRRSEVEKLKNALLKEPGNAERWQRLGELYSQLDDDQEAKKAGSKAAELYRERLKSAPANGRLLSELGTALWRAGQIDEAEKRFLQAVELDPKEWRCWMALGKFQGARPLAALVVGLADKIPKGLAEPEELARIIAREKDARERIERAKKFMEEAKAALDKAVELAPEEADTREARGWFYALSRPRPQWILLALEEKKEGGKKDLRESWLEMYLSRESFPDLEAAARLRPESFTNTWFALITLLKSLAQDCTWEALPAPTRDRIRQAMDRLKNFSGSDDKAIAASALQMLAALHFTLKDFDLAKGFVRQALGLDPGREQAWELLFGILILNDQYEELAKALRERIKHADSARCRFLLAKAHEKMNRLDQAAEDLQVALKLEPEDFHANLGYASVLMRQTAVVSSVEYFNKALQAYQKSPTEKMWVDYCLNLAVYRGLIYDFKSARETFEEVLQVDPENATAKEALEILGKSQK